MERKDSDRPKLKERSDVSSTTNSVGFQVDLSDQPLNYAIRNLRAACMIVARPLSG